MVSLTPIVLTYYLFYASLPLPQSPYFHTDCKEAISRKEAQGGPDLDLFGSVSSLEDHFESDLRRIFVIVPHAAIADWLAFPLVSDWSVGGTYRRVVQRLLRFLAQINRQSTST